MIPKPTPKETEENRDFITKMLSIAISLQRKELDKQNLTDLFEMVETHKDIDLESRSSELVSITNLLENMALRYTMPEELEHHNAAITSEGMVLAQEQSDSDDLTFF